jgi:predicted nucleic acid-binding protein
MILVDSTVWIAYFNGQITPETDFLDRILAEQLILVGDLILCEVLQGFRADRDYEQARLALGKFQQVSMLNARLAILSANHYRTLRKRGITIRKTIDCLIATFCIEAGHQILHADRDFDAFEEHLDLQVVHADS